MYQFYLSLLSNFLSYEFIPFMFLFFLVVGILFIFSFFVSDEGITGRHLSTMKDEDLKEMGLKKGSRIDILQWAVKNSTKTVSVTQVP